MPCKEACVAVVLSSRPSLVIILTRVIPVRAPYAFHWIKMELDLYYTERSRTVAALPE